MVLASDQEVLQQLEADGIVVDGENSNAYGELIGGRHGNTRNQSLEEQKEREETLEEEEADGRENKKTYMERMKVKRVILIFYF